GVRQALRRPLPAAARRPGRPRPGLRHHRRPRELPLRPAGQPARSAGGPGPRGAPARTLPAADPAEGQLVRRIGLLLALLALAGALAAPAGAVEPEVNINEIEEEVMCPVCGTLLALAESPQ